MLTSITEDSSVVWEPDHKVWHIKSQENIQSFLNTKALCVVDFRQVYGNLVDRFGMDFTELMTVLDKVPLGLDGAEHLAVKRSTTKCIKKRKDSASAAFERRIIAGLNDLAFASSVVDLQNELIGPAVVDLMSELAGVDFKSFDAPTISQLFDANLGLNRRKQTAKKLEAILSDARKTMTEEEAALATAIIMVGADSIYSTLGVSLLHDIKLNHGRALCDYNWSDLPPVTGVPYADRIACKDFELQGIHICEGQRVRLRYDLCDASNHSNGTSHFGGGEHLCLGKAISIASWRFITRKLSESSLAISLVESEPRSSDCLFNALKLLKVRFHDL